jgi:HK97 family phage major capsid protein
MTELETRMAQLADIDAKLDALLKNDELNDSQQAEHDTLLADRAKCVAAIEREHGRIDRENERAKLSAKAQQAALPISNGRQTTPDAPKVVRKDSSGRPTATWEADDEQITVRFGDTSDAQRRQSYLAQRRHNANILRSAGYQPWGEFKSFSDFVRDGFENNGRQRFDNRVNAHYAAVSGMSEGVGADGGYMVMPEFAGGIIDRVYANDLWGRTDNYSVSGNNLTFLANAETSRASGSRHGGMRGYWVNEGGTITSSKPTLREVSLKLVKLGVVVYLTDELIADGGAALQEYVARKASEEFQFMIGDALVNGTGVGQPLGMLNFPSLVSVAKETGQGAATFLIENVEKMYARFYAPGLPSAVWLHNQDIAPQLNTMTLGIGAAGVPVYLPPGGASVAPYGTLKGRPMLPTEFNATLGTQGDLILADMKQILSISKGGVAQAVSMHVQFLTEQTALRFTMRLNAGPWESSVITPYKGGSNTQSNFVTLDARS